MTSLQQLSSSHQLLAPPIPVLLTREHLSILIHILYRTTNPAYLQELPSLHIAMVQRYQSTALGLCVHLSDSQSNSAPLPVQDCNWSVNYKRRVQSSASKASKEAHSNRYGHQPLPQWEDKYILRQELQMQLDSSISPGGRTRPFRAISYSMLKYHGNRLILLWQRASYQLAELLQGRHN